MECIWCSQVVHYESPAQPGHPDAVTDLPHLYLAQHHQGWHSYTLVTSDGSSHCPGQGALSEPGVAVGQYPVHQVTP